MSAFKPVDPAVQGELSSLLPYFVERKDYTPHGQLAVIQDVFADKAHGPCRIIAADDHSKEVHFENRELLNRYTVMLLINQAEFLTALRKAMAAHSTEKIFLNDVSWSIHRASRKKIRVDLEVSTGTLSFSMMN